VFASGLDVSSATVDSGEIVGATATNERPSLTDPRRYVVGHQSQLTVPAPVAYRAGMGPAPYKQPRQWSHVSRRERIGVAVLLAALGFAGLWLRSYRWGDQVVAGGLCAVSGDGAVSPRIKGEEDARGWGVFAVSHRSVIHDGTDIHYSLIVLPLGAVAVLALWTSIRERMAGRTANN
jgi:hypothetical protein